MDEQSLQGKVVGGVLKLCQKYDKPLIVLCGQNKLDESNWKNTQITQVIPILNYTSSVEDAIFNAAKYLRKIGQSLSLKLT